VKTYTIQRRQWVPRPLDEVFDFFSKAENLGRLTPPFLQFQITRSPTLMQVGARIEYKLRVHGVPVRWLTDIEKWAPPHEFVDVQRKGPYKLWHHTHRFWSENSGTWIEDTVRYALPFGVLCRIVNALLVQRDVQQIFDFRQKAIQALFP